MAAQTPAPGTSKNAAADAGLATLSPALVDRVTERVLAMWRAEARRERERKGRKT